MYHSNPLQRNFTKATTFVDASTPYEIISNNVGNSIVFERIKSSIVNSQLPKRELFSTRNVLNSDLPLKQVNPQILGTIPSNDVEQMVTATSEYLDLVDNMNYKDEINTMSNSNND